MAKRYRVELTLSAQRDILTIWSYIAQDSPVNAERFTVALEEKALSLAQMPERNPVIPEAASMGTRQYRHLLYRDYRIVYRVTEAAVYVLRVFHGSRLLDLAALD